MIRRKLIIILLVFLVFASSLFTISTATMTSQVPSAVVLGRYVLWNDNYWTATNKTIQQLLQEGYNIDGAPNELLQVNYTRLNYTFKSKIAKLAWPNVTVEMTEGEYDLNVTVHKILGNGTIGEEAGSFLRKNQPSRTGRTSDFWDPAFGVGFNPSVFWNGNTFTGWLEYHVTGPEILYDTPWGQNETFVLTGETANSTFSAKDRFWCDAETGIVLKRILDWKMQNVVTHEELIITETGIETVKESPDLLLIIGISVVAVMIIVAGTTVYFARFRQRRNVKEVKLFSPGKSGYT